METSAHRPARGLLSPRSGEDHATLFAAAAVGLAAGVATLVFQAFIDALQALAVGPGSSIVAAVTALPPAWRLLVPAAGGLAAGLVLEVRRRYAQGERPPDYIEAVVLGDGTLPVAPSLLSCLSAAASSATGASIGREGPLVQLAALTASGAGSLLAWSAPRRRLLVACGAAAGVAVAYNAPVTGALFVSELLLGSVAMETFGPLVLAALVAAEAGRFVRGGAPLYTVPALPVDLPLHLPTYLLVGLLAGVAAPLFLRALRLGERTFAAVPLPAWTRPALGGLAVGALACSWPLVCGNGGAVLAEVLRGDGAAPALLAVGALKLLATAITFGSGAVGGVLTPTLVVGATLGGALAAAVAAVAPAPGAVAAALVGMSAFFAATTHAPLTAILLAFELTLDPRALLPCILACVVAATVARALGSPSVYRERLERAGGFAFARSLLDLRVDALLRPAPPTVRADAGFADVADAFLAHNIKYVYVVDEAGGYRGAIALRDVKAHLADGELPGLVVARDLVLADFPSLGPEARLDAAVSAFARHDGERLPVVAATPARELLGFVTKTDVLVAVAQRPVLG